MRIGVPKPRSRIASTGWASSLDGAQLTANRHQVLVETGRRRRRRDRTDADYQAVGAEIAADADQIYGQAEARREGQGRAALAPERKKLRQGQILFTYLHLAADPAQTKGGSWNPA